MNDYAGMIGGYAWIPKSVLAAIVVRLLLRAGSNLTSVSVDILNEWTALHQLGIVTQSPKAFWWRLPPWWRPK